MGHGRIHRTSNVIDVAVDGDGNLRMIGITRIEGLSVTPDAFDKVFALSGYA